MDDLEVTTSTQSVQTETTPLEPINYEGWAPCFHASDLTPETQAKRAQDEADWISSVIESTGGWWGQTAPQEAKGMERYPDLLQNLLWVLSGEYGSVTCVSDQWVAVSVEGGESCELRRADYSAKCGHRHPCRTISSYIQGDDFLLALVESYRWWKERELAATSTPLPAQT